MRASGLRAAGLIAALLAGACARGGEAGVDPADCRRLELVDGSGRPVVGAEDLAVAGGRLFVAAYDRLGVGRAADGARGPEPPAGGVYALPLQALGGQGSVRVTDLLAPVLGRATRPHGIDAAVDGRGRTMLAVVARDYVPGGRGWERRVRALLLREGRRGWRLVRRVGPVAGDLNDVAVAGGRLLASFDGGAAPLGRRGRVVELAPGARVLREELRFANGLAVDGRGGLWVAETRGGRVRVVEGVASVSLPGGPDNLTRAADGRIVAALHPSLIRFALHRFGLPGGARAGSRVVAIDPATGAVEPLFDDPGGRTFAGATVGLLAQGKLVLGGVREAGLLVCPAP